MSVSIRQQLMQLNRLYKESDEIYHDISASMGLSDSALIILYGLCHADHPCTQSELCEVWSIKKQTVRSAVHTLLRKGYVLLEPLPDNPHIKQIVLTEAGKDIMNQTAMPLIEAEEAAFGCLTTEERETLLALTQKQVSYFRNEAKNLLQRYNMNKDCTSVGGLRLHEETEKENGL
ncbi:MarR family winged helix-turn-helix transcriptional regulator [Clostridium sp. Marseille-P299]|uniref:MarR family winged helix-turn-helix transcriptional regulator n=1 Tax=Clostridium sp. Marseille-P299 TaxID=1805477 RepID=UPI00082A02B0|nr:MarR family transcriptional regulator [Clostridium sp. Marseille-P299]